MEITWTQPYDGNSVILNYIVQYKLVACKLHDNIIDLVWRPIYAENRYLNSSVANRPGKSYSGRHSNCYNYRGSDASNVLSYPSHSGKCYWIE